MIGPLYVVAMDEVNNRSMRLYAVEQLYHISELMGIRQARVVADFISKALNRPSDTGSTDGPLVDPLIPFC